MIHRDVGFVHSGRPVKVTSPEQFVPIFLASFYNKELKAWGYTNNAYYGVEIPLFTGNRDINTTNRGELKTLLLEVFNEPPLKEYVLPMQRDGFTGRLSNTMGTTAVADYPTSFSGQNDYYISRGAMLQQCYPGLLYQRQSKTIPTVKSPKLGNLTLSFSINPFKKMDIGVILLVKAKWIPVMRLSNWVTTQGINMLVNIPATDLKLLKSKELANNPSLQDTVAYVGNKSGLFTAAKNEGFPTHEVSNEELLSYLVGAPKASPTLEDALQRALTLSVEHKIAVSRM